MIGFLNINKPPVLTSHDVVARVRRLAGRGVKVGHAGTLDPAATGVLPVALGGATRLIEYLTEARKGYRARVALGSTTTTDDAEGDVLTEQPVPPLDTAAIEAALAPLRGPIMQVPPMYAALRHQGQRLYELARAGQTVERPPRPVVIDALTLLACEPPYLTLDIACSKGTYIRSLARDLGAALGCGAHLAALERTFVGPFALAESVPLTTLQEAGELAPFVLPPAAGLPAWEAVTLSAGQLRRVRNGQRLTLPALTGSHARAHAPDGELVAVLARADADDAEAANDAWQPVKVIG